MKFEDFIFGTTTELNCPINDLPDKEQMTNKSLYIITITKHLHVIPHYLSATIFPCSFYPSTGWDQSSKFVKLYVTLPGVHTLPKDDVTVDFTSR